MKKTVLMMSAVAVLALTSCKKENVETTTSTPATTTSTTANDAVTTPATTTNADIPDFDDARLDDYAKSYEEMMVLYKDAITNQDMGKMQELQAKATELSTKGQTFTDISPEDAKKLQDYTVKKSHEMQALVTNSMGR